MAEYYDPETYPKAWNYLQTGTIIDQYMVERELAHGGFSSVYLARQLSDQYQVALKEYLPRKLAHRTWNNVIVANSKQTIAMFKRGRALFFEEAKVLANLKHPNIVEVTNFFRANETVYMVMTYDYGVTLDKIITKKTLPITEEFLLKVFNSLLAGISYVHERDFVHLDIKPANILVCPGNDALLLDFGAIQNIGVYRVNKLDTVLTPGYSPIEQYDVNSPLGGWTDIYAIGASLRTCLETKTPVPAVERKEKDNLIPAAKLFQKKYPDYLLKAIDWAMAVNAADRPQTIAEFKQALVIP
ncbi:MAG: serine/threonine protein kinase [Gammaproteobacteria bacterium]|nr:serine/threonine protein kinase [Gammaproteobacteria bacterium]